MSDDDKPIPIDEIEKEHLANDDNADLAEYVESNAKWVRKETRYLQTEIARSDSFMVPKRAGRIEETCLQMAFMLRCIRMNAED